MSLSGDTRRNHPWEFPDCPECDRHIYVDRLNGEKGEFLCHKCGVFTL